MRATAASWFSSGRRVIFLRIPGSQHAGQSLPREVVAQRLHMTRGDLAVVDVGFLTLHVSLHARLETIVVCARHDAFRDEPDAVGVRRLRSGAHGFFSPWPS